MKRVCSILAAACALGVAAGLLVAQPAPSVKRTVLMKQDASVPGREVIMALVELPPGSSEGKHTHPAEVYAYVLDGTPTLWIEGKPTQTFKAGDVFTIGPGQVHEGSNKSAAPVRISAVFFAEKGKPLTTPVP